MKNIITGTALLLASSSAFAGVITETLDFGIQGSATNIPVLGFPTGLNQTLSIAGFDNSLGSLTGVDITVYGQIDTEGSSRNDSLAAGRTDVNLLLMADWQVATTAADDYVFASAFTSLLTDESSPAPGFDMAVGDTFTYDLSTGEQSFNLTNVNLAAFTTGSAVDFVFTTQAQTILNNQVASGSGVFTNSFDTGSWGKVEVAYTYDATPVTSVSEPGSLAILALGLVGFAASRKKKSA